MNGFLPRHFSKRGTKKQGFLFSNRKNRLGRVRYTKVYREGKPMYMTWCFFFLLSLTPVFFSQSLRYTPTFAFNLFHLPFSPCGFPSQYYWIILRRIWNKYSDHQELFSLPYTINRKRGRSPARKKKGEMENNSRCLVAALSWKNGLHSRVNNARWMAPSKLAIRYSDPSQRVDRENTPCIVDSSTAVLYKYIHYIHIYFFHENPFWYLARLS